MPWRREWQPTPLFLAGESHGQRSLVSYSPWGRKESDMTEWPSTHTHTHTHTHSGSGLYLPILGLSNLPKLPFNCSTSVWLLQLLLRASVTPWILLFFQISRWSLLCNSSSLMSPSRHSFSNILYIQSRSDKLLSSLHVRAKTNLSILLSLIFHLRLHLLSKIKKKKDTTQSCNILGQGVWTESKSHFPIFLGKYCTV